MKKIALLLVPALFYADNLKSLLDFALSNNKMVQSRHLTQEAKSKELDSAKSSYFPTLDIGAYHQSKNERTPNLAGDIQSGYAKIGFDIYDGGKKSNTIKQNEALLEEASLNTEYYKKSLQLDVVQDFYTIKSTEATLKALEDKKTQLAADLERIRKFFSVGSATIDDVDKLQASYSNNLYQIEQVKYQLLSLTRLLSIKLGKNIATLEDATVIPPVSAQKELSDNIKGLQASSASLQYAAESISSAYYPQLRLENTYNIFDYERTDALHPKGLDNQNTLMLTLNMRLFDNGAIAKQKEAVQLQKMALDMQIKQLEESQDINAELAAVKIDTTKAQIQSAKQSLDAANSAYDVVAKKFEAGVVDNVAYLDALSVKTNAKAQYETALNALQIAYANYYFTMNHNIKDYIK